MVDVSEIRVSKPVTYSGVIHIDAYPPAVPDYWMLDGFCVKAASGEKAKDPGWHVYQIVRGPARPFAGKTDYCLQTGMTKKDAIETMKRYAASRWNEQLGGAS